MLANTSAGEPETPGTLFKLQMTSTSGSSRLTRSSQPRTLPDMDAQLAGQNPWHYLMILLEIFDSLPCTMPACSTQLSSQIFVKSGIAASACLS